MCGELFLTKTLYQYLTEIFLYRNSELWKAKVLLLARTSVASIKENGTFIHTGFNIPVKTFGKHLPPLSDEIGSMLRNKLLGLKGMIIEKIEMVSNDLPLHIHLRLVEKFACPKSNLFSGITVITITDFLWLPPVRTRPVRAEYINTFQNVDSAWDLLETAELTEVIRGSGDIVLINLLNLVIKTELDYDDVSVLKLIFRGSSDTYPKNDLRGFPKNFPRNTHSKTMLNLINNGRHLLQAKGKIPKNVASFKIGQALNGNQNKTSGLAGIIKLKANARVMLTGKLAYKINSQMVSCVP